ncbi:hypothetical protein C7974DRAFT_431012 [Boeremia exigua]|uniref:uncharacterized protein n=1 Tax=Boeremia exigua TaxID=749465 RepID=UPI001E8E4295|nr:uncharacterized protein C7974DRAFT_431012 [Boeremia exigua]KAH6642595.1 hypothetical protein C7974DRAFT_431012 [Boeremia exigua]
MALVSRFFVHRQSKTEQHIYTVDGNDSESHQLPRKSSSWRHLFASKQKGQITKWVPTVAGMVKAGDEGLWTSALVTNPHGHPGEVSFEAICEMFANELRLRSMTPYSGEIGNFINSARRGATGPRRVSSVSHKRAYPVRGDIVPSTQRKSLDITSIERGIGRSLSVKRPTPLLIPFNRGLIEQGAIGDVQRAWMKDGRPAEYQNTHMGVTIKSAELAALSVLLGSSITSASSNTIDKGAFGISIRSTLIEDGRHMISLERHKRSTSQLLSSESGHSPLFAKHLACGSLPFLQDAKSTSSILLTDDALEAIRSGVPVTLRRRSQQASSAKFLATLPNSRELAIYAVEASTKSSPATPLIEAIALLPFSGGLVPLASSSLIGSIYFIASDGLHPGRLLQRLEGLVDKVQRHSPHLNIFGPLYETQNTGLLFRERERLGKVATGAVTEDLADKVARMQRYVTLLQRIMALVPDLKPHEVFSAVQEATKRELSRSYADAITAYTSASVSASPNSAPTIKDTNYPRSVARSSGSNGTLTSNSARLSMTFPEHNLAKQVEALLKSELPFSVDMIAVVARLILVAWTLSVGIVAWEDGEEGFRVPDVESLHASMFLV